MSIDRISEFLSSVIVFSYNDDDGDGDCDGF